MHVWFDVESEEGCAEEAGEEVPRAGHTDKHVRHQVASALTMSEPQFDKTDMLSTVSLRRWHRQAIRRSGKIVPEIHRKHSIKRASVGGYQN